MNKPVLVVNRGYGVGKYTFDYYMLDGSFTYLLENHILYFVSTTERTDSETSAVLSQIIKSFDDSRTKEFISLYFGTNAINATELTHIMPIYL